MIVQDLPRFGHVRSHCLFFVVLASLLPLSDVGATESVPPPASPGAEMTGWTAIGSPAELQHATKYHLRWGGHPPAELDLVNEKVKKLLPTLEAVSEANPGDPGLLHLDLSDGPFGTEASLHRLVGSEKRVLLKVQLPLSAEEKKVQVGGPRVERRQESGKTKEVFVADYRTETVSRRDATDTAKKLARALSDLVDEGESARRDLARGGWRATGLSGEAYYRGKDQRAALKDVAMQYSSATESGVDLFDKKLRECQERDQSCVLRTVNSLFVVSGGEVFGFLAPVPPNVPFSSSFALRPFSPRARVRAWLGGMALDRDEVHLRNGAADEPPSVRGTVRVYTDAVALSNVTLRTAVLLTGRAAVRLVPLPGPLANGDSVEFEISLKGATPGPYPVIATICGPIGDGAPEPIGSSAATLVRISP